MYRNSWTACSRRVPRRVRRKWGRRKFSPPPALTLAQPFRRRPCTPPAAASHDLRQPMQALSMYTSVLHEQVANPASHRVIRGIELSVSTLEQLFDSLLDISKIESGVIKPDVTAFALLPLIEHVVDAERPLAAQKNLDIRVVRTAAGVRSDPALLARMLKNLVTNAIRYSERGGIVVGCRRQGARLRLEVVD